MQPFCSSTSWCKLGSGVKCSGTRQARVGRVSKSQVQVRCGLQFNVPESLEFFLAVINTGQSYELNCATVSHKVDFYSLCWIHLILQHPELMHMDNTCSTVEQSLNF